MARLQLAHNRLGAGGVMQLAATLGANPRLAYVGLSANHIGEDGAFVLGANLLYNDRLEELDVRHPLPSLQYPSSPFPLQARHTAVRGAIGGCQSLGRGGLQP